MRSVILLSSWFPVRISCTSKNAPQMLLGPCKILQNTTPTIKPPALCLF